MMLLLNIGYMLKSIVAVPPHISLSSTPLVIYITSLMPQPSIPFCHSTKISSIFGTVEYLTYIDVETTHVSQKVIDCRETCEIVDIFFVNHGKGNI
jgi:hypothetical protein